MIPFILNSRTGENNQIQPEVDGKLQKGTKEFSGYLKCSIAELWGWLHECMIHLNSLNSS